MATPAYPGAVKAFGADLENLVNIVYAAHVNDLRAEVVAVETEIGLGLRKSITWANRPTFDRPTGANFTWGDLSLRLINIEAGLVSSAVDIHPQYFLTTGGSLTGPINMGNNRISNLTYGEVNSDAVAMGQLNDVASVAYAARNLAESTSPIAQQALFLGQEALPRTGGTMTGNINMGGRYLLNIGQSGAVNDAATVGQVNTAQSTANTALTTANAALPSSYVKAGVGSAMLSSETIEVTVTLGTSPTGRWSVVAVPTGWAGRVRVVSVTETTATIHIYDTAWTHDTLYATPQPLCFWQAFAY